MQSHEMFKLNIKQNVELVFMKIPAGEFIMGSTGTGDTRWSFAHDREKPQHTLYLEEFWMGKYPIINRQFIEFVKQEKYQFTQRRQSASEPYWGKGILEKPDHPVTQVTWYDAQAFCKWASRQTNILIRLPEETEWEKASRGVDGRIFPWGNSISPDRQTTNGGMWQLGDTTSVGKYSPQGDSPFGCVDMSGNVDEWVNSSARAYPYVTKDKTRSSLNSSNDPVGKRGYRGGSFDSGGFDHLRSAYRGEAEPEYRGFQTGFRVCFSKKN